jgi:hypothetical protein
MITATDDLISDVSALRGIRERQAELKTAEELLKGRIIIALGDKGDTLAGPEGEPLITYRMSAGRKSFDTKTFQTDEPDLYSQYTTTGEGSRRFIIK